MGMKKTHNQKLEQ